MEESNVRVVTVPVGGAVQYMPTPVKVVDFDIPFFKMVGLMVKIAIASVPAMFILLLLGGIFSMLVSAIMIGMMSR